MNSNGFRNISTIGILLLVFSAPTSARGADASVEKGWYTPAELLTRLAERDSIRWALPETLAGRALVSEAKTIDALLDDACKQWGLVWVRSNGVIVVHRADDDKLKRLTTAVEKNDRAAAWELGWSRDGRALPLLAEALAGKDIALALTAAQAIEVLDTLVPLGRDERVDSLPTGRVSLAVAFPPKADLKPLLDSPYPPLRAAALRLLLGQGGKTADEAKTHTAEDRSSVVRRVRQEFLGPISEEKPPEGKTARLIPTPKDADELKAACAKIVEELPGLAKQSEWEQMRWRVRSMGAWSRAGHQVATDTLIELCSTKIQQGWFPGYVQLYLASTGSPEVLAKLKEMFPKADRATLSRGLEQTLYGNALLSFTKPHLSEQTLCYVTARKAGREAQDDLLTLANRGEYAAIDALGVLGGVEAVDVLKTQLNKDTSDGTLAFRSAKALARIGSQEALDAILAASESKVRWRRHAATLFLGHIGGSKATARLKELLDKDTDRMVRAAAAEGLEQIGDKDSRKLVEAFRKVDEGVPDRVYQPRNVRFNDDFPVNEWVNLKITIKAFAEFGEMGWNYDASNRLFFRYGGCSGYTNELTLFDLGTEQFVQRRPNEEMAGWGDRRSARGCTGGRAWDPYQKVAWIGPVIGGGDADLAIAEYYNKAGGYRLCSYDLATDRFRAAPYLDKTYGGPATRYAYDWKNGLLIPVKFSPFPNEKPFTVIDTKSANPYDPASWLDKKTKGDYPRDGSHQTAAVDHDTGLLVVYIAPRNEKPAETWTYDPTTNTWKNVEPKVQPQGVPGAGFVYDPFQKVLLLQSGKKATQFGGGADSITWTYDVRTNTWTDLGVKTGPGNPWVGAMDYDPEHNVFVLFNHRDKQVWAYRYKAVKPGTKAK